MKLYQLFFGISLMIITLSSCVKDSCTQTRTFVRVEPVVIGEQLYRQAPKLLSARPLENPGIIYVYGQYLLINERFEGIHLFDNSNPSNPTPISFIEIPGNEHFAIYKNTLLANQYDALVALDIKDVNTIALKSRMEGAFGQIWEMSPGQYLAHYIPTEETQEIDCSNPNFNSDRWFGNNGGVWVDLAVQPLAFADVRQDQAGQPVSGVGGSTARFTITQDHLYIADQSQLSAFDLEDACDPDLVYKNQIGWDIETIYPFQEQLFIGSSSGMFIFDVSTPGEPIFQSRFEHARACDPVVADESTAYVTLRDGTFCEGFANQLDVIDVNNVYKPSLLETIQMQNPHGLALFDNRLYVCEGDFGLKIFDVADRKNVHQIAHHKSFNAKDVIVLAANRLLIIGDDGFMQFDASQPGDLKMISTIESN